MQSLPNNIRQMIENNKEIFAGFAMIGDSTSLDIRMNLEMKI